MPDKSDRRLDGRLSVMQLKYCRLIADGMKEPDAVLIAGYSPRSKFATLQKLKRSPRIKEQIAAFINSKTDKDIADREDREKFWTSIMNDPSHTCGMRLEASKLLGKAQGDFIVIKKTDSSIGNPIVIMPNSTPAEWEKHWEKKNA